MNKKDAAEYLGISTRALEYYYTGDRKRLSVRKVKGKTGDVADFDPGELRQLKAEIDAKRAPRAAVVRDGHESSETEARSLARLSDVAPAVVLERLTTALERIQPQAKPDGVSLSDKLMLSIPEAAAISGISPAHLRAAVQSGKLKAKRGVGRGLGKVKRADLDAYVRKL